ATVAAGAVAGQALGALLVARTVDDAGHRGAALTPEREAFARGARSRARRRRREAALGERRDAGDALRRHQRLVLAGEAVLGGGVGPGREPAVLRRERGQVEEPPLHVLGRVLVAVVGGAHLPRPALRRGQGPVTGRERRDREVVAEEVGFPRRELHH